MGQKTPGDEEEPHSKTDLGQGCFSEKLDTEMCSPAFAVNYLVSANHKCAHHPFALCRSAGTHAPHLSIYCARANSSTAHKTYEHAHELTAAQAHMLTTQH